ncbi:MAG: DUF1735 and LamG domain-containing protein [Muribaculaceae bacterium]|nr:DUF1735 and LamG domain-containing protein [Muribaculaceae bacterium]
MKKTILNSIMLLLAIVGLFTACDSEGDKFDYQKVGLLITGTEQVPVQRFTVDELPAAYAVTVKATRRCEKAVTVHLAIDTALVRAYNALHGTAYYPVPASSVTLENDEVTIQAGEALSTAAQVRVVSTDDFIEGATYVIPVTIRQVEGGGGEVIESSRTIYLQVSRIISFYSLENNQNASSNYIFPDDKMVNLTNYTIEFKVYSYNFGNVGNIKRVLAIEGKNEEEANMFRFGENGSAGGDILQWVLPGGRCFSTTHFKTNRWYLVSCTYDGQTFKMYVDGVEDAQVSGSGKATPFQRFELGMSWGNYRSSQFFQGRLCEVRLWSRALTASEIATGFAGVNAHSDGLVAYWKMNEGEGHIFHDATGHGYDMDWTDTWRDDRENGVLVPHDYSQYIRWVKDDNNKVAQ